MLQAIQQDEQFPAIDTPDLVEQAQRRWQFLAPEYKAASTEEAFRVVNGERQ